MQIVGTAELLPDQLGAIGKLNLLAYPGFYGRLQIPELNTIELCAELFFVKKGELANARFALEERSVIGFFAGIPSADLPAALSATALHILKRVSAESRTHVLSVMEETKRRLPPVPPGTHYLARLAVVPERWGGGLARMLMDAFFEEGISGAYSVHVERNNHRAIRFYTKLGFDMVSQTTHYLVMHRRLAT
jgi:ribosomal protein S18 acetylase RimI-like enzyme